MKISLFRILTLIAMTIIPAWQSVFASWRMHPNFTGIIGQVIDTPSFVYFTSQNLSDNIFLSPTFSLFRYDKDGEDLSSLSADNLLTDSRITQLEYNPGKGYVIAVCDNNDIVFINDDGSSEVLAAYRLSTLEYPKTVNSVNIDLARKRVYLATDFGYVALNDDKREVAESRVFGQPLKSVCSLGDYLVVIQGDDLLYAPIDNVPRQLNEFTLLSTVSNAGVIKSLGDSHALFFINEGLPQTIRMLQLQDGIPALGESYQGEFLNAAGNRDGVLVAMPAILLQFKSDGTVTSTQRSDDATGCHAASLAMREVWNVSSADGLFSEKQSSGNWVMTSSGKYPDAPSPFKSAQISYDGRLGLVAMDFGFQHGFTNIDVGSPFLLSAYADGQWENLSPGFTSTDQANTVSRPSGFAIDPDNPEYVYVSTVGKGFARYDIRNADDIVHFSRPSDPGASLSGFIPLVKDQTGDNAWCCRFSAPVFDSSGNLWLSYTDLDNQSPSRLHLYCWEAADRKSFDNTANITMPELVNEEGLTPSNTDLILPLSNPEHRNWLIYCNGVYDFAFMVIDTNGTPADSSDDRTKIIKTLSDKDGNAIYARNVRFMKEDSKTGMVWVGHSEGVFCFNPDDFMEGTGLVNRVKISRNDGTNLADWFLNDVTVTDMTLDSDGRRWFATNGAGIVALSADGNTIHANFDTSNSDIPDDVVYSLCYSPESNSIMMSTDAGMAEYLLPRTFTSSGENSVRAYPNPVRPGFGGYVTIDGIPADAIVKIADSSGNVVKELNANGTSEVKWDVTGKDYRRVASGVYFILASERDSASSFSSIGKILVIN